MNESLEHLQSYKERLFNEFGRLGKALYSPRRLELLDLLCQTERTVEDLMRHTGLSASNVSQHLSVLRDARLVASRKDGLFVHYRLADPVVGDFWRAFRNVAIHCMAEARELVNAYTDDPDDPHPVDADELHASIKAGNAVLLDVRPSNEYDAAHLPGALSIPLEELETRIAEIPKEREIIAYCRGPFCLMAHEAVRLLRRHGIRARRAEEGIPEWRAQGQPVESNAHGHHDKDQQVDSKGA